MFIVGGMIIVNQIKIKDKLNANSRFDSEFESMLIFIAESEYVYAMDVNRVCVRQIMHLFQNFPFPPPEHFPLILLASLFHLFSLYMHLVQ